MKKTFIFIAIVCSFLGTSPFAAQAQVTPDHVAKIKTVTSSTISDDGQWIAYTVVTPADPKKENMPGQNHLYVYDRKSQKSTAFFTSSSVSQVNFRPGHASLTFLARKGGETYNSLYEMSLQGGEAVQLFSHDNSIIGYEWNTQGDKIVFTSFENLDKPKTPLTYAPIFYEEDFKNRYAYIADFNKSDDRVQKINVKGAVYQMEWSPNGQKIALSVAPTSSVDDSYMEQKIQIVDAKSGNKIAELQNEGKLGEFKWSPDGRQLAILGAYDINDPTNGSLFIASAEGGKPKVIDGGYLGKYLSVLWENNHTLWFCSDEGTSSAIGTIAATGQNKAYYVQETEKSITSFSKSKNGVFTFTANTPTHPTEVFSFTYNKKQAKIERLTNNNPWLDGLKLGKQEVVRYKARDGKYTIEGLLIYPLDYQKGTKYPLITVVHGGPESHYSNGWLTAYSMPGQMAAAKGYAVFYPNYRGSTGRGTDFTYSSQADLAGAEFDDIVDGVDYLIDQGIADKKRVGVTGGSYGGYASAWMSTYYSDRFAAAVMFVGISNNISKFGTSDIPNELFLVHSRKRLWDDWKWQLERSPIYYVEKAQTPILIMHGAEDPRVHPGQSLELYRHLKVRKPDLPLRLILYPGEGHGNIRSGSRYDYNFRMLQWFDTYLKTGNAQAAIPSLDFED